MDNTFKWTDELVLIALDLAHHNGYHKFPQRCVDLFDEVKNQAMKGGYQYPKWVTEHLESKQPKKEPIPLFTTEDGKNIFTGDTYWSLTFNVPFPWDWEPQECKADYTHEGMAAKKPPLGMKQFSTKEAADRYVLWNKPEFSIQIIMDRLHGYIKPGLHDATVSNLTHFIKSKING